MNVPPQLIGDTANLGERLLTVAQERGLEQQGRELLGSLDGRLLNFRCFFDPLTQRWRYVYGLPIRTEGQVVIGTHMFTPVERLFDTLLCARHLLPKNKYQAYIRRLLDESRHQDVLAEMMPVLFLDSNIAPEFEMPAETGNGRTIDWIIKPKSGPVVRVEVKNRMFDMVGNLTDLSQVSSGNDVPEPRHEAEQLFSSTIKKFRAYDPSNCIHGVWVVTGLKQEESDLRNAFAALDPQRLHFAVIINWSRECYLLTQKAVYRKDILNLFHLVESGGLVFRRSR